MEGAQRYQYVLEPGVLSAWDEADPHIVLGPVAVQVRAQGMPRAAPRKVPLRRPLPQRKRCGGGHQPVYLLDQPQWPALAELEAADDQHGRSAFRARASEDGVVFDPHAVTAGLPVRTLNPRPTTPQPLAALAALGFCASAAPKGSVFSHIGGTRAAGRAETVTQVSVRPRPPPGRPLLFVVSPGGPLLTRNLTGKVTQRDEDRIRSEPRSTDCGARQQSASI